MDDYENWSIWDTRESFVLAWDNNTPFLQLFNHTAPSTCQWFTLKLYFSWKPKKSLLFRFIASHFSCCIWSTNNQIEELNWNLFPNSGACVYYCTICQTSPVLQLFALITTSCRGCIPNLWHIFQSSLPTVTKIFVFEIRWKIIVIMEVRQKVLKT